MGFVKIWNRYLVITCGEYLIPAFAKVNYVSRQRPPVKKVSFAFQTKTYDDICPRPGYRFEKKKAFSSKENQDAFIVEVNNYAKENIALGGFHLHLLVFPFVYQFSSIIVALVHLSFANDYFRRISTSFQNSFVVIAM